jgi:hypothetical protein
MNHIAKRNPLVRFLGSVKLTIVLLAAFGVAIAVATFLEVRYGSEGARVLVYNARWFEVLLAVLILNLLVSLFVNIPYRRSQTGYVITHIAFIIVLVSAGITRYFGYEGTMSIREGSSTDYVYSAEEYVQISTDTESAAFPVHLYKPGKNNLGKKVKVGGESFDVSVVEYWPHFENRMIETPGGEPVIVYTASGMGGRVATLKEGETLDVEGVTVHFLSEEGGEKGSGAPRGELVITMEGKHHHLAVPDKPPAEIEAGGYRFRITEFAPDFRVGEEPSPSDPMNNPAIRVAVEGPGGEQDERMLFAYHPDFDMGHSGREGGMGQLDLVYRYERNFYLFRDSGALAGRADFHFEIQSEDEHAEVIHVDGGERFEAKPGLVYHSGNFALLLEEFLESAVERPSLSDDTDKPAAARIAVQDETGNPAEVVVQRFRDRIPVDLGGREVVVYYGPLRIQLPYRLHLDDFVLTTYPGSDNPASFESHVRIYDEERGVNGRPIRIYMNHPLDYRGFRHFQSSYDRDRMGTILSVNHDPGKLPTYFGYTLVGLGFLITLTRGLVWYRNPQKQRGVR